MARREKASVAILGATGAVGQKFVRLLENHPWFEIGALAASERSAGRPYAEAVSWKQPSEIPSAAAAMTVQSCSAELDCPIVFSGLDSSVAGGFERQFARRGAWVFSNPKNHRMDADVPLVIPELNPDHLQLVPIQQKKRGWSGAIVTNANCSTIILALSLGPLQRRFGLKSVQAVTFQAISGAGYPGVPSWDVLGNVVPYIGGEEEKIESETQKILGGLGEGGIDPAPIRISAQANRVAVEEGHLECVSVEFHDPPSQQDILDCWRDFRGLPQQLELPSAPHRPILVNNQPDRPQPRLDVNAGQGMSITIGRLRPCPVLDFKYVVLGHNTIRGAAGASILNAELVETAGSRKSG
ncbi:MAG: aspartate-semialdehyde dehydrogenase [Acidobacteriota bacterium]